MRYQYAAKSLQSCLTLCNPIDSSPSGSPVPGILQARTLEWVAISFSNAWKWKVKVKSESEVTQSCPTLRPHGLLPTRLLHPWDFPGKSTGVRCHCLLHSTILINPKSSPPALLSLLAQCDKPESSQCFIEIYWLWVLSSQPESINYTCTSVSCSYSLIESHLKWDCQTHHHICWGKLWSLLWI